MVQSDVLSRREDWGKGLENDNKDLTLLPETMFIKAIDIGMQTLLAQALMKDKLMADAIKALKTNGTPPIKSNLLDWEFTNSLLFFKKRCYVPPNEEQRKQKIEKYKTELKKKDCKSKIKCFSCRKLGYIYRDCYKKLCKRGGQTTRKKLKG